MSTADAFNAARRAAMKPDRHLLQAAVAGQEAIRKLHAGDMAGATTQMAIMLMSVRQFDAFSTFPEGMFAGTGPLGGWEPK